MQACMNSCRTPSRSQQRGSRAGAQLVHQASLRPGALYRAHAAQRRTRAMHVVRAAAAIMDPATKLTFPEEVNGLKCLGAGVREKKIAFVGVKVYSVALYVDPAAASAALKAGKTLLSGDFDKLLSIKLARKVDGATFWKALDEALMPRIAQLATDAATAEDANGNFMSSVAEAAEEAEAAAQSAAKQLGTFLSSKDLDTGVELVLHWRPEGVLEASVTGAGPVQSYKSKELCKALFDVYLGADPVSPPALLAFENGARAL